MKREGKREEGRIHCCQGRTLGNSVTVPWQTLSVHSYREQTHSLGSGKRMRHRKGDKGMKKLKVHLSVLNHSCLRGLPVTPWGTEFCF